MKSFTVKIGFDFRLKRFKIVGPTYLRHARTYRQYIYIYIGESRPNLCFVQSIIIFFLISPTIRRLFGRILSSPPWPLLICYVHRNLIGGDDAGKLVYGNDVWRWSRSRKPGATYSDAVSPCFSVGTITLLKISIG